MKYHEQLLIIACAFLGMALAHFSCVYLFRTFFSQGCGR